MAQKTKRVRKSLRNKSKRRKEPIQKKDEMHREMHRFYSKMVFDGNTMMTETQKDNEPVKRRRYTLEQLEREIPIGAELIKEHLDRKVPQAINYPLPKEIEFKSVLPNPIDLGLMPPQMTTHHTRKHRKHHHHHRRYDDEDDDDEEDNLHLMMQDHDQKKRPRDVFGLP